MCRLCTLYNKIDLGTLPNTNPWDDEEEFTAPPTTIMVESPESARYTAWSNVRRFPSLLPLAVDTGSNSSIESVEKPQEYRGIMTGRPRASWQPVSRKPLPVLHELQRRRRVDSFTAIVQQERLTATPESMSPVSEKGFEFGFKNIDVTKPRERRRSAEKQYQYQAWNPSAVSLVPAPLRVRTNGAESPSDYINGLCQNW